MNIDGIDDVKFSYKTFMTHDVPMSRMSKILNVASDNKSVVNSVVRQEREIIDETIGWRPGGAVIARHDWSIESGWEDFWNGTWAGADRKFIGIQILIQNKYHYGWIELSVRMNDGCYMIHDYAYNPVPNEPILAGVHPE